MNKVPPAEKEMLLRFIERNVINGPDPKEPDEGIGTVYERIVIDEYFRLIQDKYQIKTVLENPADGVTGVPGINSLEFARHRQAKVTLCNPSQLMIDGAKVVWEKEKLMHLVEFIKCEIDKLPFADNTFDLAWNYCMFERFADPNVIVNELKRVSNKYVMVMTQNRHNLGTLVHWAYHKYHKLEWDHGSAKQMTFKAILKSFKENDLEVLETGTIDTPPWLDTWDMPLRGELKSLLGKIGMKWEWKNDGQETAPTEKSSKKSGLIKFSVWIEKNLPNWFARSQTHHYYVLARKK
ncbi:MAG: class I SAM-dependent methyltransferase [Patescibacteria group bacterium]